MLFDTETFDGVGKSALFIADMAGDLTMRNPDRAGAGTRKFMGVLNCCGEIIQGCVRMLFQPMYELLYLNVVCHGLLEPVASFPLFHQDLMP